MATFSTADPVWVAATLAALRSRGFCQVDRVGGPGQFSAREKDGKTLFRWVDSEDYTGQQLEQAVAEPALEAAPEDPVDRALAALHHPAWARLAEVDGATREVLRLSLPIPPAPED